MLLLIGITIVPVELANSSIICPQKCICTSIAKSEHGYKLKCGGKAINKLTNFKEIDFGDIRHDVVQL